MRNSEDIRKELIAVEKAINGFTWKGPSILARAMANEKRSELLKELQAAQMREWNL